MALKIPYEQYNKYAADYVLIPTDSGKAESNDFTKSELWKNQEAYKTNMFIIIQRMKQHIQTQLH